MKTLIVITAVAFAAIASAVEKPKMNVIPLEADKAIIALSNATPAYFEISINSEAGNTIYYKESKSKITDYKKIYDFSALNDGNYEVSVKVNDTRVKRDIEINRGKIYVGDSKVSYDPFVLVDNEILKISYLNFDEENIALKIYENGEMVYQSKLGKKFAINAGYDLSKLRAGNYQVVLEGNDELYAFSYIK
ncbi:MAG: hypothetical protein JXR31_05535 [Prolixibacteraceae bacterium]|nr:hypothetical protein [Prolixibacteraceae bacterium]MBN2773690.1 hypothetical protein [Prolixibacteraceae bacterium]